MHHSKALALVVILTLLVSCGESHSKTTGRVAAGQTVKVFIRGSSPLMKVRNSGPDPVRASFVADGQSWVHFDLVAGKATDEVGLDATKTGPITIEILSRGELGARFEVEASGNGTIGVSLK